jgi:hypothetical protein
LAEKYGVTYPIVMDRHEILFTNIGLRVYPTTIFFRPSGVVSCVHVGTMDAEALHEEYRYALGPGDDASPTPEPPPGPKR